MRGEPLAAGAEASLLGAGELGQFFRSPGGGRTGLVTKGVCRIGSRAAVAKLWAEGPAPGALSGAAFGR